jgi:hypothetical protein
MSNRANSILIWTPRITAIAFALFLTLFSFDVFEHGFNLAAVSGFFMHNVPVIFLLLIVFLGWRREWIGAILFTLVSLLYLISVGWTQGWETRALIGGPAFLVGLLYWVAWRRRRAMTA